MTLVIRAAVTLIITHLTLAEECVPLSDVPEHQRWEEKLRKEVIKWRHYASAPPKINCTPTEIHVSFKLRYFSLNSNEATLTTQLHVYISWTDSRLKWDPKKYGGIKETEVHSIRLWRPMFKLYNSVDLNDDYIYIPRCTVENTGDVTCTSKDAHETRCVMEVQKFPYDVQECALAVGSRELQEKSFIFKYEARAMSMLAAEYGSQWLITDYKQYNIDDNNQLNIVLTMEREAESLAAVIIYPSLIISALTIACTFLDVRKSVRLILVSFSIISHYYWLSELALNLPKHSLYTPSILVYYRGSMILTVLMFFVSLFLTLLCKKENVLPNILMTVNDLVYNSNVRFLIFPRWNIDDVVTNKGKFHEDWTKFCNIISVMFAIVIIIAYVSLYLVFMPQPPPIKY